MNDQPTPAVRCVSIAQADALVVLSVAARSRNTALQPGDPRELFVIFAGIIASMPPDALRVEMQGLASFSSDEEWAACRRVLEAIFTSQDHQRLIQSCEILRIDWRKRVVVMASMHGSIDPSSCWSVMQTVTANMLRMQPSKESSIGLLQAWVQQMTTTQQPVQAVMLAAYADEQQWPAIRRCLETCRVDLVWVDQFRIAENRAAALRLVDREVEAQMRKQGRRFS